MQGKLIFKLPEEHTEFQQAVKAGEAHSALWDMDQYLRGRIKYEDLPEPVCTALEAAREKLNELTTAAGLTLE